MKKILFVFLLFCISKAKAQDTFHVERVLVKHKIIYAKTGRVMRRYWRKEKVKKGYIVRLPNGFFLINGKEMKPDNFSYSITVKK